MKTRRDNDVVNRTSVFYTKNNTELLWSIKLGVNCDENQTKNNITDCIGMVYVLTILNYCDQLDRVLTLMKTK